MWHQVDSRYVTLLHSGTCCSDIIIILQRNKNVYKINWCKMLLWNNRKKHSLNTIVKCSLAWMQYICSFESERKQIECFKTSSSATGAVTQNLFFHLSFSCVGLIVWEKAVSHPIFIFSLWFLFEFILILATLYHARAHHFIAHHFDLFILWDAESGSTRKLNHQQFFASPSRPLQDACVCKLFQQSRRKGPNTKSDINLTCKHKQTMERKHFVVKWSKINKCWFSASKLDLLSFPFASFVWNVFQWHDNFNRTRSKVIKWK